MTSHSPGSEVLPRAPLALSVPSTIAVDPYSHDSLRAPFIDIALRDEAISILGEVSEVESLAHRYFSTCHRRLPILSKERFLLSLPFIYSRPRADYILLCLSVSLVLQQPKDHSGQQKDSMQSSLYVTTKCLIASLEAANYVSLDFVQARVLVCWYELGHGIYPAALASIASCASISRALGLECKAVQAPIRQGYHSSDLPAAEEEKRVRWAIINLDRSVSGTL